MTVVRRATPLRAAAIGVALAACAAPQSPAVPPPQVVDARVAVPTPAAPGAYADTLHGVAVPDPYRWLEDTTDARVVSWVAAQRAYTDSIAAGLVGRDSLAAMVDKAFSSTPTLDVVIETPSRVLLTRWLGPTPSILAVDSGSRTERMVLSADSIAANGKGGSVRAMVPSWDGALLAAGTTGRGDSEAAIRVLDAATGRQLSDRIPDLLTTTSGTRYEVTWLPDGSGFFYPRLWPGAASGPPAERLARGRQFLHRLGTPQSADVPVFGFGVSPHVPMEMVDLPTRVLTAPGSRWAVGSVFRSRGNGTDFYVAEISTLLSGRPVWSPLATSTDRVGTLQLRGDTLYALSRKGADRGAIVRRLLGDSLSTWATVVAERAGVIQSFTAQADGLYFTERGTDAISLQRQVGTGAATPVKVPSAGTIRLLRGMPGASGVTIATESWVTPPHWMRVRDGGARIEEMPFDDGSTTGVLQGLVAKRLAAPSRDGTRVPVSLVYGPGSLRNGVLDGTAPLLMEVYGAYGQVTDPFYNPFLQAWVALGGVYAWVHARGGGELGDTWHTAAMREHKQRTIDDVIGAIESLIAQRYTSAGRVALMGISSGAIVPGLAAVQRPGLFGAILFEVGQPDEIRGAALDPTAARNIAELGDMDTPEGVRLLVQNSPYHQVPDSVSLPAMIVHSASEDYNFGTQMLSAKYVARLQRANRGGRPVMLMQTDGGHRPLFGLGPARAAQALSFVLWQTGVARYQPR